MHPVTISSNSNVGLLYSDKIGILQYPLRVGRLGSLATTLSKCIIFREF